MAADDIVLQAVSEHDANCLATALQDYAVSVGRGSRYWEVSVGAAASRDGVLDRVIEAAMECFAEREVAGFALIADGRRYPLGIE